MYTIMCVENFAILYTNYYYINLSSAVLTCLLHTRTVTVYYCMFDNHASVHRCKLISIPLILIVTYKLTITSTVLAKVYFLFHFASIFSSCSNETCNSTKTCSIQTKVCDKTTHRLKDFEREREIRQPSKHLNEDQEQC